MSFRGQSPSQCCSCQMRESLKLNVHSESHTTAFLVLSVSSRKNTPLCMWQKWKFSYEMKDLMRFKLILSSYWGLAQANSCLKVFSDANTWCDVKIKTFIYQNYMLFSCNGAVQRRYYVKYSQNTKEIVKDNLIISWVWLSWCPPEVIKLGTYS